MELVLCLAACASFWGELPLAPLLLRCALEASQRFSPRAALALSALAALSGCLSGWLARGGMRTLRASAFLIPASFAGGTLGRALVLMVVSRFSGSLALAQLHAPALLLLTAFALASIRLRSPQRPSSLAALAFFCGAADGFLGAGGVLILERAMPQSIMRRSNTPTAALLAGFSSQLGALLLTLAADAAEVFPGRMLAPLMLGAALGAFFSQPFKSKKRGAIPMGLRLALRAYLFFAALSCAEQAFLP